MKLLFIALFVCILHFFSNSQNTGLYGKRTFFEFNTVSYMPIFSWFMSESDGYSPSGAGNGLTLKKDLFDYGFRFAVGRSGKKNVGASFEVGYNFSNLSTPQNSYIEYTDQWGNYTYKNISYKHERLDVRTISFMPKIEFTSKGGTLPVGLNHQIGLGFSSSKILERDYKYQVINSSGDLTAAEVATFSKDLLNYENTFKGMTFLYAFNIRTPLSKSLMINYGIRYTLNVRNYFSSEIGTDQKYYEEYEVRNDLRRMRLSNVLAFNLGLTFAL